MHNMNLLGKTPKRVIILIKVKSEKAQIIS